MLPSTARGRVLVEHHETASGIYTALLQVIGRTQPGLPGTDHHDLGLDRQPRGDLGYDAHHLVLDSTFHLRP
jgi:hypothetical protein